MWGAYFCMGAYKRDVVVVIKMGAYIHGVLILCGCGTLNSVGPWFHRITCVLDIPPIPGVYPIYTTLRQ